VIGDTTVRVVTGDITGLAVDAVVNAANEQLIHAGGVAAAIARAGEPDVDRESRAWIEAHGPLLPGSAAVTRAGSMPAEIVVHVVGPRYHDGADNATSLAATVRAALDAAAGNGARTIALPAISAGIFGYPRGEATLVIATEVADWVAGHRGALDEVVFVAFDTAAAADFSAALDAL
jgi:O-acetyl-ADP-ribose deacetylase